MEAVAGLARDERNPTFWEIRMARWVTAAPNPTYGLPSPQPLSLATQAILVAARANACPKGTGTARVAREGLVRRIVNTL